MAPIIEIYSLETNLSHGVVSHFEEIGTHVRLVALDFEVQDLDQNTSSFVGL